VEGDFSFQKTHMFQKTTRTHALACARAHTHRRDKSIDNKVTHRRYKSIDNKAIIEPREKTPEKEV
jgi:hypothetical protein